MPLHNLAEVVADATVAVANETGEPPTVYVTQHLLSQTIAGAFAEGCGGKVVTLPPYQNDKHYDYVSTTWELMQRGYKPTGPMAAYGILRGCGELIGLAKLMKHDYWHIDNGYVKQSDHEKNDLSGYYRITKNGFQNTDEVEERPSDRWNETRINIVNLWNRNGKDILVIPPSKFVAEYQRIDPRIWMAQVDAEIKKRTDRPIRVKAFKGGLKEILPTTHCVITHESMAALHAVVGGVPAIALGDHCLGNLSWKWEDLEYPNYFDRGQVNRLCHWLAYNQFTLPEIKSGKAWAMLHE